MPAFLWPQLNVGDRYSGLTLASFGLSGHIGGRIQSTRDGERGTVVAESGHQRQRIGPALSWAAVSWLFASPALAQRSLDVAFLERAPTIDGEIGEAEWAGAGTIDQSFVQITPNFGATSPYPTVVRVGQTATALYIAFEAFDPDPSRLSAAVTSRDGGVGSDDSVSVALDSFGDDRTAYLFRTNPLATQEDGRIADNGRVVDRQWDAAWLSAATRHEDRWTAEFEIPFSVLRYATESDASWGVNFVRTIPRRLETSLWSGREDDLGAVRRVDVVTDPVARRLELSRGGGAQPVHAAVDVGVVLLVEAPDGVDDRARFLRRRGVVQIDERLAPDQAVQDREVLPRLRDIEGPGRRPVHHPGSFSTRSFSIRSRAASTSMRSVTSRANAWISMLRARSAGMPRARR